MNKQRTYQRTPAVLLALGVTAVLAAACIPPLGASRDEAEQAAAGALPFTLTTTRKVPFIGIDQAVALAPAARTAKASERYGFDPGGEGDTIPVETGYDRYLWYHDYYNAQMQDLADTFTDISVKSRYLPLVPEASLVNDFYSSYDGEWAKVYADSPTSTFSGVS
jgi:hypothetical protein